MGFLQNVQHGEVFLPEGHPETGTLDGRIALHKRLKLLMVKQIRFTVANIGIFHRTMNRHRVYLYPLTVFPILATLRNLPDVDFGVEVGGERLAVVAGVAIDDVEIVHLVEVVFGGIRGVDAGHAGVEAAAEQRHNAGLLETIVVSPLPAVLELRLVAGFVVGRVHVVGLCGETGVHQGQILIRQRHIDQQIRLVAFQQTDGLLHIVGIDLSRLDTVAANLRGDGVAFCLRTRGQHDFSEYFRYGSAFVSHDGSDAARSDDKYSCHFFILLMIDSV